MKKLGKTGKLIFYFVLSLVILLSIFLVSIIIKTKVTTIETSDNDFNSDLENFEIESEEQQEGTADVTENTDIIEEVKPQETEEIKSQETKQATETSSKNSSVATKAVAQTTKEQASTQSKSTSSSSKSSCTTTTTTEQKKASTPSTTTTTTQNTVKKFTQAEINAEKSKYLNDIKSIAPGLNYVYSKRGQVFWPYRTSEISVFTHNLSFGTIYYYVDTFVEGGQEKFKYYIDWAS